MIDGQNRVIIERISPVVDDGLFPAKRVIGDEVIVEADIFADGHDVLSALLLYRHEDEDRWKKVPMQLLVNDRWQGIFVASKTGTYAFTVTAWVNGFKTWHADLLKRIEAKQTDIDVNLLVGSEIIRETTSRAKKTDNEKLCGWSEELKSGTVSQQDKVKLVFNKRLIELMERYADRDSAVTFPKQLTVSIDRERAGYSTWYEMFPRSHAKKPGLHGTFKDCKSRLPYIAEMGFDVLYFPPIHPIGRTYRKGKNNAVRAGKNDPGTPWAIGADEGGHKAIHPELGTLDDFRHLVAKAHEYGMEIALDIAFQCSPDHPYIREHPEWFLHRPDGSIQYAENPPKKYQDIFPLNFNTENWQELWEELKSVVIYWVKEGVRILRVDNPHTKPFRFWEWLISEVKKEYPDVIFLAEAFTRPKVMYRLAKLGFTQSYTYFTWRNSKAEITDYLTELTQTEVKDFFRPNFWPNTPDILHEYLQTGGRPAFITRLVLAATLSSNYGIYGPAFELMENITREPGSEEYLNSEKYEIKQWDIKNRDNLKDIISRVNLIRRENRALHRNTNLWFNATDNDNLICYSKHTRDLSNIILIIVNLAPRQSVSGWMNVPLDAWGLDSRRPYEAHELLSDNLYTWMGEWNQIEINPDICPAHIYRITQKRTK